MDQKPPKAPGGQSKQGKQPSQMSKSGSAPVLKKKQKFMPFKEPEPEEEEYGPDNPPPQKPVPPGPPKKMCPRCGHKYLFSDIQLYAVQRQEDFYNKIMEMFKQEKWVQKALVRIQKEVEVQRIRLLNEPDKKKSIKAFLFFCELCYNQLHQEVEFRELQNQTNQLYKINRAHSAHSEEVIKYNKNNEGHNLGYVHNVLRPNYLDPSIKNRTHGAKLVKWKLFIHCEKFIDFQKSVVFSILNQSAQLKHEQPTEEDLEKIKQSKELAAKQKKILRIVKQKVKNNYQVNQQELSKNQFQFPIFLHIKFGAAEPKKYFPQEFVEGEKKLNNQDTQPDFNFIQKILVCDAFSPINIKQQRVFQWDNDGVPVNSEQISQEFDWDVNDPTNVVPVYLLNEFKLFNFYANEKSIKVADPPKGLARSHSFSGPNKPKLPMAFMSNNLARNVELYNLPFKGLNRNENGDVRPRNFPKGFSIMNHVKTFKRKRIEFMKEFFEKIPIEFRLTIGPEYENSFAESKEMLLKDLCNNVEFDRQTQVNKYTNIIMKTGRDDLFNLRVNIGVCLDSELSQDESQYLLPQMQNVDDFQNIYMLTHNFMRKNKGYHEIKINKDVCPEGLPYPWFKIARQKLITKNQTMYEDPTIHKRVIKKYQSGGLTKYFVVVYQGKNKVKEFEMGTKPPTATQVRDIHVEELELYQSLSKLKKEEKEAEEAELDFAEVKEMDLSPQLNTSQRIMRNELDEIKRKIEDDQVDKELEHLSPDKRAGRLMKGRRSQLTMRGVDQQSSPESKGNISSVFDKGKDEEPQKITKTMVRDLKRKEQEERQIKNEQIRMMEQRHQKAFLRQSSSLTGQLNEAKKQIQLEKKLKSLPAIITTTELDAKVTEDEKFISQKYEKEKKLINLNYKNKIQTAADVAIDPQVKRRLEIQAKFYQRQAEKERKMKLQTDKANFDPQKLYEDKLQNIYQKNMTNLLTKGVEQAKTSEVQRNVFPISREFEVAKITEEDIEALEKYEKLLYNQHRVLLIKLKAGGQTMLKQKDKKELAQLVEIKYKKKALIEKFQKQKEEQKYKELESRITTEVLRGIRRGAVNPNV